MKRIYIALVIVGLMLITPILLWIFQQPKFMNIAIIDKTITDSSYREHAGLIWALNQSKYETEQGEYQKNEHYFGTRLTNANEVEEKALPVDYSPYDIIYIADTYGVYEDDLNQTAKRQGERSEKVIGGLAMNEWKNILDRLADDEKSMLIAEYNTFASPTAPEVRQEVLNYFEMDWTGWVGRYFEELDYRENMEIPQWLVQQYGEQWAYSGAGFLLVNDFTNEVVVLEQGKHIDQKGIRLQFTDKGQALFGIKESPAYNYWFDIITTNRQDQVLANYEWDLTEEGKGLVEASGIPLDFAAVIQTERKTSTNYYFAGDYNDVGEVPRFYQAKGLATVYRYAQRYADNSFYWSVYVPMMKKILRDFEETSVETVKQAESPTYHARINEETFEVLKDDKWEKLTFKGVNIGMGKPGYFPGEAAITEEEYYRWFQQIADMNANTIRNYTLHPPGFYKALACYNEDHDKKLYLLHGVWIEEEGLVDTLDAYDEKTWAKFKLEMETIIDVVHGNKQVAHEPGHASGLYDTDISDYVIGWVIGIEWYPLMVENTNIIHQGIGEYNGTYMETKGATPFEHWLAHNMDHVLRYEYENYEKIRPMSFTNWVSTDLLDHPSEPDPKEDLVGVDPNTIYTKGLANETGQFASYHVYPYYPDFLNYDKEYLAFKDHRGQTNSYAGYLADLRAAHRMPVLIAEFGIPGSRGLTHANPYGWNQGFVSEQEQGEILVHLYEDILQQGYLGGLVFTWQDEWFKRTWNTMEYDNPDRRPYWSNAQTNEQQFGLLSFDRHKIQVDGSSEEWTAAPLYEGDVQLTVDHDERYLYVLVEGQQLQKNTPKIVLDVVPNQGKQSIAQVPNVQFTEGIEFVIDFNRDKESTVRIDPYYDFFSYLYGHKLKMVETATVDDKKTSHVFNPILYALNKGFILPESGERLPFQAYETGKLIEGNGNPEAADYNSLADYTWTEDGVLELRIPWLLIQAKDPSKKEFMGDVYKDGDRAAVLVEGIRIGLALVDEQGKTVQTLPQNETGKVPAMPLYTWENWDVPLSKERLKKSYYMMQDAFQSIK